ncbi:MAG: hypothetical protein AAB897_00860 [Patescibacteria group bacterium]
MKRFGYFLMAVAAVVGIGFAARQIARFRDERDARLLLDLHDEEEKEDENLFMARRAEMRPRWIM